MLDGRAITLIDYGRPSMGEMAIHQQSAATAEQLPALARANFRKARWVLWFIRFPVIEWPKAVHVTSALQ
jgi:hypothetical protein